MEPPLLLASPALDGAAATASEPDSGLAAALQELPHHVLALVLARLSQRDRLGRAALACRAFAAAANAASSSVILSRPARLRTFQQLDAGEQPALWAWLAKHGSGLRSMREVAAAAAGSSGGGDELSALSGALASAAPLALLLPGVSAMAALTALHLRDMHASARGDVAVSLLQLRRLRSLGLCAGADDLGALAAALAGVPQLQALHLRCSRVCERGGGVRGGGCLVVSRVTAPGLARLTALHDLRASGVHLAAPGAWSTRLRSLTRFELRSVGTPPGSTRAAAAAAAELLRLLGRQTALAHVHIAGALQAPVDDPRLYASLVHSSITYLSLTCVLPLDAGYHMFGRPGLRLPHLRCLELAVQCRAADSELDEGESNSDPCITSRDLASIAACCKDGALARLVLWCAAADGVDYGALQQLGSLRELRIVGGDVRGVSRLTQLRGLSVDFVRLTDLDLVDFALQLTRLTSLSVPRAQLSDDVLCCLDEFRDPNDCTMYLFDCDADAPDSIWALPVHEQVAFALEDGGLWHELIAELADQQQQD